MLDQMKDAPTPDSSFSQRIQETAQRIAAKYSPPAAPSSTTEIEALAQRLRLQIERARATLHVAGEDAQLWFGRPQDCLSVCGNIAHLARQNHLLTLDIFAAGFSPTTLPSDLQMERPTTAEATWEFLLHREADTNGQAMARLQSVNEHLATLIEQLPEAELNRPVETYLYNHQTLRDLLLIIIEQGAFTIGQAWGVLKLQPSK